MFAFPDVSSEAMNLPFSTDCPLGTSVKKFFPLTTGSVVFSGPCVLVIPRLSNVRDTRFFLGLSVVPGLTKVPE
ncbi:hypothetical protein GCM10007968_05060 [Sporolactobacillus putidus]|uniref:Uncharacterized protein n=1 Tax=Sporolactobacillus putidus TaxID=492735 RepID=A0A917RZ89_9BACL|nr:hypothetical protein GCM10007968_05060 [Sporolactobacillus putidus]